MKPNSNYVYVFETVGRGHPDKVADSIVETLLQDILANDPAAHCGIECAIKQLKDDEPLQIVITGEITTSYDYSVDGAVKLALSTIGYRQPYIITNLLTTQSPDINNLATGFGTKGECVGDNGVFFGAYGDIQSDLASACKVYTDKVTKYLGGVPSDSPFKPDFKCMFYFNSNGELIRLVHNQHITIEPIDLLPSLYSVYADTILLDFVVDSFPKVSPLFSLEINPNGPFTIGGPLADSGLSGRKIVCDTNLGIGRIGGGALFGKDYSKSDRSVVIWLHTLAKELSLKHNLSFLELKSHCVIGDSHLAVKVNQIVFGPSNLTTRQLNDIVEEIESTLYPYADVKALAINKGLEWFGLE